MSDVLIGMTATATVLFTATVSLVLWVYTLYGNVDTILGLSFKRVSQLSATPHAPCDWWC